MGWNRFLENSKYLVEIVAIIWGGWWAYHIFGIKEAPSLVESISMKPNIEIDSSDSYYCLLTASLEITNIGKTSFEVDSFYSYSMTVPIDSVLTGNTLDIQRFIIQHPGGLTDAELDTTNSFSSGSAAIPLKTLEYYYPPGQTHINKTQCFLPVSRSSVFITVYFVYAHLGMDDTEYGKPFIVYDWKTKVVPNKK